MAEYIEREALLEWFGGYKTIDPHEYLSPQHIIDDIAEIPSADVVPVVRCYDCVHAVSLERNCELNPCLYMHCNLWRGDETRNVWHKYKRYYRDYSLVERDDFCSYGERKGG